MANKQETKLPTQSGVHILSNLTTTTEQLLELIDEDMLNALGEMATDGFTVHEMAAELHVSYAELMRARLESEDFDNFCSLLETKAVGKHLASARSGIKNPGDFSAAAYDRVMGALGFTPHVAHVNVQGGAASSDTEAEKLSRQRVGFDVKDFMKHHRNPVGTEPIDITPEQIVDITPEPEISPEDLM